MAIAQKGSRERSGLHHTGDQPFVLKGFMACGRRFCCVSIPYYDPNYKPFRAPILRACPGGDAHDTTTSTSLLCCRVGERTFLLACLARIAPRKRRLPVGLTACQPVTTKA